LGYDFGQRHGEVWGTIMHRHHHRPPWPILWAHVLGVIQGHGHSSQTTVRANPSLPNEE
jgi:hypothetical protein